MNYMSKIAEMLGVEIGEEFKVKGSDGKLSAKFYIIDDGLYEQCKDGMPLLNSALLRDLLIGRCEIIKLPWKPKYWDIVWSVNTSGTPYEFTFINSSDTQLALYKLGKIYRTREEAEAHAEEDKAYWDEIQKELEE